MGAKHKGGQGKSKSALASPHRFGDHSEREPIPHRLLEDLAVSGGATAEVGPYAPKTQTVLLPGPQSSFELKPMTPASAALMRDGVATQVELVGRARECAVLDGLVDAVRRGESRALLLRGAAGVGKSVLLQHLVRSAPDLLVLKAAGVESEMELPYASLHQLCAPVLDRLPRLVDCQREALEIVFGLSDGGAPDRFLVGLAVLGLLSEVATERPLLCVVDDAQWMDHPSGSTLGFVARRLGPEAVGIVFGARTDTSVLGDLPEIKVRGLGTTDAQALLTSAVPFKLDDRVRDRIVAETRGNPLALIEIPRGLTAIELAGGFAPAEVQSVSGRLEASFVRRLRALPSDEQTLLLVAAAEPTGDPSLLMRACERLGITSAPFDPQTDGLLEIGGQVTFCHPLVRATVYRSAEPDDRRAVHSALADVTDEVSDPDRRAWHRAVATIGPDENIASELERSADRAHARGGLSAAAAFLERSASLSRDPERKRERALRAAQLKLGAGAFQSARALLVVTQANGVNDAQDAELELIRAQIAFAANHDGDAPALLLKVAQRLESQDLDRAREAYLDALSAAIVAGRTASPGAGVADVSLAARAAGRTVNSDRVSDLLLHGATTLFLEGRAAALPTLTGVLHLLAYEDVAVEEFRWLFLATTMAVQLWDDELWSALCDRYVELGRQVGALSEIPLALTIRVYVHMFSGELGTAASLIGEMRVRDDASHSFMPLSCALHLSAMRGREAEFSALSHAASEASSGVRDGGSALSAVAKAILYNGLGRYQEALAAAQQVAVEDLATENWAMVERIEAAVRAGRREIAVDTYQRLQQITESDGTGWSLGLTARCGALLGEGDEAEKLYREAIARLEGTRLRPELARAHLLYGEWLRREGRRVAARTQLRAALEQFVVIGMDAFAERARRELVASGETARKRTDETRDDLTPQERQIAQLAADGLSNPEIGARMFLSPRTVEWHLRKVYAKLDIRSRVKLAGALAGDEPVHPQG